MSDLPDLARGLLTLEINTIVSDGIPAERMPLDGQALIRIAQLYKDFLLRAIAEVEEAGLGTPGLPAVVLGSGQTLAFQEWAVRSGGMRTYTALRLAVRACQRVRDQARHGHAFRSEHDAILSRVGGACEDIQALLRRLKLGDVPIDAGTVELAEDEGLMWPAFDHDTILTLRRIWETGVDVIVMQTRVHLDGGIVTRILDGWDVSAAAPVHDVHYRAVDIALARWSLLVETARDIAGFFLSRGGQDRSVQNKPSAAVAGLVGGALRPSATGIAAVVDNHP